MLIKLGAGGVNITPLHIKMRVVLREVERLFPTEPVITETWGGTHSNGSFHAFGQALDFRLPSKSKEENVAIVVTLKDRLGDEFDIVLHDTHIHIEYDPN